VKKIKKIFSRTIPGLITGGADNDPAGISTYSIAGARFGYSLNWLMVLATPMLIAVQAMCARLGDVKRKGLTLIIKEHYHPAIAFFSTFILIISNIFTLGADVAGMSAAVALITKTHYWLWIIPLSILIWYIVLFKNFKTIEKYLFWLVFVFTSYIFAGILSRPNWSEVFRETFIPDIKLNLNFFMVAIGCLGTTITPHLFFWQTKEEIEEKKPATETLQEAKKEDIIVAPGFIFSQIITLFIMISTGTVLYSHGITDINSAHDAAMALEPFAGGFAQILFAVGIIGSGLMAVPVLASTTAFALAETFNLRDGLSDKIHRAKGFYTTITLALLVGAALAFLDVNPIKALFYSQILAGMLGPFLLILIILLCNNQKILGDYVNGWFDNLFGWLAVVVMLLGSLGIFWQVLF
jgi:NRAMP (natural resistance-associated macrophage protein)-like metal ion transporter